jgi:hypothetical protein
MGIELLRFIRTSPTIPFAFLTALIAFMIFVIARRRSPDTTTELIRMYRIMALIVLWGVAFYDLFLQP